METKLPADFIKLMSARFFFTIAVQIQSVILGWQMYTLTKSAFYLGLIGLAEAIPALGLALYSGYIVDKGRPLLIYRYIILLSIVSAIVMLSSFSEEARDSNYLPIFVLFAASALTGVIRSFSQPVVYSLVPRIVKRQQLERAAAWMTSTLQIGRIAGPGLAGLLIAFFSVITSIIIVCVLLIIAFVCAVLLTPEMNSKADLGNTPHATESAKEGLLAGLKFVMAHKILLPALSLDMVAVLFGGVVALLPIYAAEILMTGPQGLGALRAAPAVGAIVGGLIMTSGLIRKYAGPGLLFAVAGFGFSILAFSLSSNFGFSLFALGMSGFFDSISMVIRSSAVQLFSPDEMRGRISSVNSMFIGSSNELGEFESGVLASAIGVVEAAVTGAIICLGTVGVVAFYCKTLRELDLARVAANEH